MTSFAGAAARVDERDYADLVLASVEEARRRVWAAIFLYDVRPARDVRGRVLELTEALAARRRAGVDVRVLVTGLVDTPDLDVANLATGLVLARHGVPHRRLYGGLAGKRRGTHAKFAVFDDVAVLGSQNWTDDAFHDNVEDALLLTGEPAGLLAAEFRRLWALGKGLPRDATP